MSEFRTSDGINLSYEILGDGMPVLLLHGFGSNSSQNWEQPGVVDALVQNGHRPVALDARGHGRSDKPHDEDAYKNGAMVRDATELLDHLGIERCFAAGYSMGGRVLLGLLLSEPRITAAFIGGVGANAARRIESRNRIAEALVADDLEGFEASPRAFRAFADSTKADRVALAAAMRAGTGGLDLDALAKVKTPALVVNGDGDTLAGPPSRLAELLGNAESLVVEGDHLSAVRDPRFTKTMLAFFEHKDV